MDKEFKTLIIDGTEYKTFYSKKYAQRQIWKPVNVEEIKTVIPGTVIEVNVKEGDKVKKGDALFKYEAMKMQNIVRSPHAGIVCSVNAKEGDKLPKGFLLLLINQV